MASAVGKASLELAGDGSQTRAVPRWPAEMTTLRSPARLKRSRRHIKACCTDCDSNTYCHSQA